MHVNTKRRKGKQRRRRKKRKRKRREVRKKVRQVIFSLDNQRKKGESRKKLLVGMSFW